MRTLHHHRRSRIPLLTITAAAILLTACGTSSPPPSGPTGAAGTKPTSAAGTAATTVALSLPTPTGPAHIGTVSLHLVDPSRKDTWVPGSPVRELMVQLWYPAAGGDGPRAPYMTAKAAARFVAINSLPPQVGLPVTHAVAGAAAVPGRFPVVLYAHGSHDNRAGNTTLVEDLASHGYVVAAVDHTHLADEVEFPDGRVETEVHDPDIAGEVATRVADDRFVLDALTALAAGGDPTPEHTRLPVGLGAALDPGRVGMFGASFGGVETAAVLHDDPRVKAGANLDGPLAEPSFGPIARTGEAAPLLTLESAAAAQYPSPTPLLHGWHRTYVMAGAQHLTYSDGETLAPQAQPVLNVPDLPGQYGTIAPGRAVTIQRTFLLAFFDWQLTAKPTTLFDGPPKDYPEMTDAP